MFLIDFKAMQIFKIPVVSVYTRIYKAQNLGSLRGILLAIQPFLRIN